MAGGILLVAGSYPPDRCGVGDYTRQLATALAAIRDIRVGVLTTGVGTVTVEDGVEVHRSQPGWTLRDMPAFVRALRRIRPAIVHVQYPTQGYGTGGLPWLIPLLAWLSGACVAQTWHESFNRRDLPKVLAMALVPGRLVVVREAFRRQFRPPFGTVARWRRATHINSAATLPEVQLTDVDRAALRTRHRIGGGDRLILFFGFLHPLKRVELLFELANPLTDYILVMGDAHGQAAYRAGLAALANQPRWRGRATVAGFVAPDEAAALIGAADAVVLPLQAGGGEWNTSVLAGIQQHSFVLTTSRNRHGYDPRTNVYYARVDDLDDMRNALRTHVGARRSPNADDAFTWRSVAARHLASYRLMIRRPIVALTSAGEGA